MVHFQLCLAHYTALQIEEVPLQSIQSPQEIQTIFIDECKKAITRCNELTPLDVSKRNGMQRRSMMYALHVLWYVKRHLSAEAASNSEKTQACSFNHCQVMLV